MNVEDKKLDAPEEYDLEDGEIDDDDDDEPSTCLNSKSESTDKNESSQNKDQKSSLVSIDLTANENTINKVANYNEREDECDDFADNLEKTMAAMLKKDGIVPKIPEIVLEKRKRIKEEEAMAAKESALSKNSRSSRRRKSRKAQKEKDREKELDKKRFKADENLAIEDDIDEDEMLGMRGASPTRKPDSSAYQLYPQYPSYVDSDYSKDCSYDSYDSSHDDEKPSKKKRNKKKSRWDKDRDDRKKKSRRNESSERSEDEQDKRNKDEPRKLELCKFYLQECCAKKDQCSYMHQEFPCKYYYLGMDCIYKDKCKYNHGEPLTDEFRNVLLKHIEMAPKEILGSFKRISRDNAINLLNKTHSKLCKQFGVQDTTAHSFKNNFKQDQMKHQVSQQLQHKKRQIQENNLSQSLPCTQAKIPSLLDLELPPDFVPPQKNLDMSSENENDNDIELPKRVRRSRWCDNQLENSTGNFNSIEQSRPTKTDLLNLKDVLSFEHIQKLLKAGVKTIEEINQLTVGQLNQMNLSAVDVMQIQEKCDQYKKQQQDCKEDKSLANILSTTSQDVDMRVLPVVEQEQKEIKHIETLQSPDHEPHTQNPFAEEQANPYENLLLSDNLDDNDDDGDGLIIDDPCMDDEPKNNSDEDEDNNTDLDSEGRILPPKITTDAIETFGLLDSLKNSSKMDFSGFLKASTSSLNEKLESKQNIKSEDERDPRLRPTSLISSPFYLNNKSEEQDKLHLTNTSEQKSHSQSTYERKSIYDNISFQSNKDNASDLFKMSGDKDMRDLQFGMDTDLRLPFQPFIDYKPATEIDGCLNGYNQIDYKVYEVEVPPPNFKNLQSKLHEDDNPVDPRLRRMLGLSERDSKENLSQSLSDNDNFDESIIFHCKNPKKLNDDESQQDSPPRFYSPFSSTSSSFEAGPKLNSTTSSTISSGPRLDPRCRYKQATSSAASVASNNSSQLNVSNVSTTTTSNTNSSVPDIKTYLPSSEWYQNLSSKHKIMVNQQLALVSTELKKFHKDTTPNKIFDMSFILNNQTLQQMLTNLLIFIDDDGNIHRIEQDNDDNSSNKPNNLITTNLQQPPPPMNLNQPPPFPNFQIDPRNGSQMPPQQMTFSMMPPQINIRPGLLGMAPQGFNPFNQPPPPIPQNNNFQPRPMNMNNNHNQRRGNNRINNRGRRL